LTQDSEHDCADSAEASETPRVRLPNRREARAFRFAWNERHWDGWAGFDAEGRVREVFVQDLGLMGTTIGSWAIESCIALSYLLQHGVRLKAFRASLSAGCPETGIAAPGFMAALTIAAEEAERLDGPGIAEFFRAFPKAAPRV